METPLFTNNAGAPITDSGGINATTTTITVADSTIFAVPGTNEYQMLTLDDDTTIEIVKMTNNDTGTGVLTVVRAQEGSTGTIFAETTPIESRITAGILTQGSFQKAPNSYDAAIGDYSLDLVTIRTSINHAATGNNSIAAGAQASASGIAAIAVGLTSSATANRATAVGSGATASTDDSTAVGADSYAQSAKSASFGGSSYSSGADGHITIGYGTTTADTTLPQIVIGLNGAAANGADAGIVIGKDSSITGTALDSVVLGRDIINAIPHTHVIGGASLVSKDTGQTDEVQFFSGQENILFSQEYDFTLAAADNVITIEIPTNSTFFVSEIGFIPTVVDTRTVYPTLEFGSNTTTDALMTATVVSTETVRKRERFSETLNNTNWVAEADEVGHATQLTVSVTVAATATSFKGRCYFKGMLVENE